MADAIVFNDEEINRLERYATEENLDVLEHDSAYLVQQIKNYVEQLSIIVSDDVIDLSDTDLSFLGNFSNELDVLQNIILDKIYEKRNELNSSEV